MQRPNATTIALESVILYSSNETSDWLKNKLQSEQKRLLEVPFTLSHWQKLTEALQLEIVKKWQQEIAKKGKELKVKKDLRN